MSARSRLAKSLGRRKGPSRFEADLDPTFTGEVIAEVDGGERLLACIQCGTCAGACPLSMFMDRTPRRLIEMVRAGARDEVLGSSAIWVCASCYACTVQCPKQIPITEIIHGLRRMAFQQGTYPKRLTNPVMTRELVAMAEDRGRSTESWVAVRSYLRTDPMQLPKHARVGMRLMRHGRMSFKRESMRDRAGLRKMLEAVDR
jgi:heterodisulfide reductase subunit C